MPLADLLQGAADAVRTHVTQRGSGGGRDYEAISAILLKDLLTFVPLTVWQEALISAATRTDVAPELNVASNMIIVDRTNASDAVLAQLANGTADTRVHTVEDALVAIEEAAAALCTRCSKLAQRHATQAAPRTMNDRRAAGKRRAAAAWRVAFSVSLVSAEDPGTRI